MAEIDRVVLLTALRLNMGCKVGMEAITGWSSTNKGSND